MLAAPTHQQRRHISSFHPHANLPSPSSPSHPYTLDQVSKPFNFPVNRKSSPSPQYLATPLSASFDSTANFDLSNQQLGDLNQYMSNSFYQNPAIRIQQSTPVSQHRSSNPGWSNFEESGQFSTGTAYQPSTYLQSNSQQRGSSAPSIGSPAPAGSYYSQHTYPVGQADQSPSLSGKFESYPADQSRVFSNNLPTPSQTPTQDSAATRSLHNYNQRSLDRTMNASLAMKQEFDNTPMVGDDELPGLQHSARHSVSSFGNSPSTPQTAHDDLEDSTFKVPSIGENNPTKVESWIDAYLMFPDDSDTMRSDIYNTSSANMMSSPAHSQRSQGYLSPFANNVQLADLLQEANKNRTSPHTGQRPLSPFRQNSPFFDQKALANQAQLQARRKQQLEAEAMMVRQSQPRSQDGQAPKTVSPKDVELDYEHADDESKMPLFPDDDDYSQPQNFAGNQYNTASHSQSWMSSQQSTAPPQSSFTFTSPSATSMHGLPAVHGAAFSAPQYRSASGLTGSEPVPDFPAHLTSMESSASDASPENTQTSARSVPEEIKRPSSTLADSGTYSCTYHGCSQRFGSPQKLQKHKREGHRQNMSNPQGSPPQIGSNMSSAALSARNSQTGPHKCERINPTTGKPCNTIFSRPYDLTRHEDTIHNGRKQKVRCALCVEEKTFSRNDALTRHMRVVHPDVDFPGKHRRRGGHE